MVRTPILSRSPGRAYIEYIYIVYGGEYFISVMYSCDVDIASGALLQHAARCQIERMGF